MGAIYKHDSGKEVLNESGVLEKKLVTRPFAEISRLTIDSNGVIDAHILNSPTTFFVISGVGVAIIDGDEITVESGDLLEIEPGEESGWHNERSEPMELLVVKHTV